MHDNDNCLNTCEIGWKCKLSKTYKDLRVCTWWMDRDISNSHVVRHMIDICMYLSMDLFVFIIVNNFKSKYSLRISRVVCSHFFCLFISLSSVFRLKDTLCVTLWMLDAIFNHIAMDNFTSYAHYFRPNKIKIYRFFMRHFKQKIWNILTICTAGRNTDFGSDILMCSVRQRLKPNIVSDF